MLIHRSAPAIMTIASLANLPPLGKQCSRLYLCRHGETDSNAQNLLQGSGVDSPLNDVGRTQAAALAESLAATSFDLVASSTLSRAMATADSVASRQPKGVERSTHEGLVEMFYGSIEGKPLAECRQELRDLNEAWAAGDTSVAVGGDGESPDTLLRRGRSALLGGGGLLGCREPGRHVCVVAHSTFNRAILSAATPGAKLGAMFSIPQDNCCVNVLDVDVTAAADDEALTVVAVNIVAPPASL
tara:strand:- start:676 stop:1407 length:732 start_codon:yes stop_codon:yes gene_type:complete